MNLILCCVSAMGRPLYQLKAGPVRDRGNCWNNNISLWAVTPVKRFRCCSGSPVPSNLSNSSIIHTTLLTEIIPCPTIIIIYFILLPHLMLPKERWLWRRTTQRERDRLRCALAFCSAVRAIALLSFLASFRYTYLSITLPVPIRLSCLSSIAFSLILWTWIFCWIGIGILSQAVDFWFPCLRWLFE